MSTRSRRSSGSEPLRVRDVVAMHQDRQVPMIKQDTPIGDLSEAMKWHRHSRQLYIVDEQDHLLGNITLGRLVMYVFASSHGSSMNPRHVIGLITCTTAGDLMTGGTLSTGMEDEVEEVLERMVAGNLDEIPVIDSEGRVVADLTMVDLLLVG